MLPALDVRNALHQLFLKPGFAVLIILLLGIGIGANTAVFSIVYGVLLHPLPYSDPGRIAFLWATIPNKQIRTDWTSWPTLQDWRAQTRSFTDVAGILRIDSATLTGVDEPVKLKAGWPLTRVQAHLRKFLRLATSRLGSSDPLLKMDDRRAIQE